MKKISILIILGYLLARCTPVNHSNLENKDLSISSDTITIVSFDTVLKKQSLSYILYLDYESNEDWKVPNGNYKTLYNWIKKFKEDKLFKQLSRSEFEKSFIIQIEAGMTKDISPKIARKRMENIRSVMTDILGFKDYDVEVFKVLRNLKYKEEHDIEIKINRLMY